MMLPTRILAGSHGPVINRLLEFLRDEELSRSHEIILNGAFDEVTVACLSEYQRTQGIDVEILGELDAATIVHMLDVSDFDLEQKAQSTEGSTTFVTSADGEEMEWLPDDEED